jgi:hypothetical protein
LLADARKIIDRVRSFGANVVVDDKGLRIINGGKLPPEARNYLVQHKREIVALLTDDSFVEREERAAIIEFDGHTPREWAEQFADILIARRPAGVSDMDWSWFLTRCGQIIDEAPAARAA